MSEIQYREEQALSLRTSETEQAAAAVAQAFLAGQEPVEDDEQPVAAVPMTAVPSVPASNDTTEPAPPATAEASPSEPFDFTSFEPQLPPDLAELLEDEPPDFEAEARAEIAAELRAAEDRDEYVEPVDTDLAARLRAAEKRNQFLEGRLVETNRSKWVQENLRAYPLLRDYAKDQVAAITATSRRGFAREAAKLNDQVASIAKPLLDNLKSQLAARGDEITLERRQQVDASWGKPAVDQAATGASADQLARIQNARKSEDLGAVIREMIIP